MRNLRRILSASVIDLVNGLRNRMVVYVLLMPVLIALGLRLLLPVLTEVRLSLITDPSVPAAAAAELSRYADLTPAEDADALLDLVSREDDVLGVRLEDARLTVVAFGDEPKALVEMAQGTVHQAQKVLDGTAPSELQLDIYDSAGSAVEGWRTVMLAIVALLGAVVGMFAVSFGVMEDKVSRTVAALGVSPLTRGEYLGAKSLAGGAMVIVVALAALFLGGAEADWLQALVLAVASVPVALGLGLLLGIASSSDVQLVTYVKAVSLLFVLPIVAKLLPAAWHPALWWAPTYWLGRGFVAAAGHGPWSTVLVSAGAALVLGAALVAVARARVGRTLAGA